MPFETDPEGAPHAPHAPTLARLRAFYARHPEGAVRTSLVHRGDEVVVRAAAYRTRDDRRPMATALAAWERASPERTDGGLRVAESRAILQALAYLGLGAHDAARRPVDPYADPPPLRRVERAVDAALRERVADLEALIAVAARAGLRPRRAEAWRRRLRAMTDATPGVLAGMERVEGRLRRWVGRGEAF